jgi:DNA-binding NtrC family response regulator
MGKCANHILIVGSDPTLRDLIRDVLTEERKGDRIEVASTVGESLLRMERDPVDLLVFDESMSGEDGLWLIERTQALHMAVHAALITAADRDEVMERRRVRRTSFALFVKPFSMDALLRYIDHALAKRVSGTPETAQRKGACKGDHLFTLEFEPVLN